MPKRRRNDAPWRRECLRRRGGQCRACGWSAASIAEVMLLECDHLISRAQGGPSVVENGLILCGGFLPNRCHERKTRGELRVRREWLDPDQIAWLRANGHAWWAEDGEVLGRHRRLFEPAGEDRNEPTVKETAGGN